MSFSSSSTRLVRTAFVFALSSSLALAQSSTLTAPVNPVATGSSAQYWIPLVGLGYSTTFGGGVDVTAPGQPNVVNTYEIQVSNATQIAADQNLHNAGMTAIANASGIYDILEFPNGPGSPDGNGLINLGLNSYFNLNSPANNVVATVPFGITLGDSTAYGGSLVIGGQYDANKVASTSWTVVQESTNGHGTILSNGTQAMTVTLAGLSQPNQTSVVTLDINAEAMVLPPNFNCSAPLSVTIPGSGSAPALAIDMEMNFVSRKGCTVLTDSSSPAVLGKPFFQAAYAYVDTSSTIYLAQANAYPLPPQPQNFDATAQLTPPKAPAGYSSAASRTTSAGLFASFVCALALVLI